MGQDIFVGVLCVVAALAGVWCWWVDNGSSLAERKKKEKSDDNTDTKDKKVV